MGRGTRQTDASTAAMNRDEVLRRLRKPAACGQGSGQGAWTLWPPDQLVGDRPDVHVHTPEWTAYLNRKELGRALRSARADCVLLGEQEFSERLCGQVAELAFAALASDAFISDEDARLSDTVKTAFDKLSESASDEQIGPLTMFAHVAMMHVHRAMWNQDGTSSGHPMRVRSLIEDFRGEIATLNPRAAEWQQRTWRRVKYEL